MAKKFIVTATMDVGYKTTIMAENEDEAWQMAKDSDFGAWEKTDDGHDWTLENVYEEEIDYKNYKMKRPKEGYNSEEERAFNQWSGVSDYDLFFEGKRIGHIYYVGSSLVEWAGYLEVGNGKHEKAFPCATRKEVFEQLCRNHHDRKGESDADR